MTSSTITTTPRLSPILLAARLGYAARGVVYVSVGLLALRAASGAGSDPKGMLGALEPLAIAPAGKVWLVLIAVGLACFALWRGIQATLDPDHEGRSPKGLMKRIGQGVSALVYAGLSYSLLELLDELGELGEADERKADRHAGFLLGLPHGSLLLMALGAALIGCGVANVLHGLSGRLQSGLDCSPRLRRLAKPIGRSGYVARGAAFGLMGAFIVRAALHRNPDETRGMGATLDALSQQPGGAYGLALIAAGLIAFGLFGLMEARYREFREPS